MTSKKTRIACIGECMLELGQFDPNKGKFAVGAAGDTLNTAAYLAQLLPKDAFDVNYVTALGTDQFSDWISEQITQWGISTDLIMRNSHKLPGLYAIELDDAGERTFRYWRQQSAARDMAKLGALSAERLADFDLIYLSGISLAILDTTSRQNLIDTCGTLRKAGCSIAFDSNYRPCLWESEDAARAASPAIQQHVEIALPSYDDEVILWGESTELDAIARIQAQGPSEIIMTTGATSVWVAEKEDEPYRLTLTPAASVVDTTAAGDSFNAGYLAARLQGQTPTDATQSAHRCACQVIGKTGAIVTLSV